MRFSTLTGTYILGLAACLSLTLLLPAIEQTTPYTTPAGTVAGVAIGGAVEPTAENTLYQQLQEERRLLEKRAQQLDAQQAYLSTRTTSRQILLYVICAVLFCLIVTNFYLDTRRARLFGNQSSS